MFVTLGNDENIILNVFVDDVPWLFAAFFGTANTQTFALSERVIHQALVFAHIIAIHGDDFARLGRQITPQEFAEFALTNKADAG
ncbi:hypothetical protein D3C78_1574130 [compost metagenome]